MSNDQSLFTGDPSYRLGDMIMRAEARRKWANWHIERYPNSLAAKYLKATSISCDYGVLERVAPSEDPSSTSSNTLVVHLRIGDVLDGDFPHLPHVARTSVTDYLRKQQDWPYVRPMSHFRAAGKLAKENGVTQAVIVAASHIQKFAPYPRSREYIRRIKAMYENELGLRCELRLGRPADSDFIYLASSRHLCLTGGNFSVIAYLLAKKRGCLVYGGLPLVRREDRRILRIKDGE